MKHFKRPLALLLAAVLLSLCSCVDESNAARFSDVPTSASYSEAVYALVEMGVFGLGDETEFKPTEYMTRATFAAALWRLLGCPEPVDGSDVFVDVPDDCWYRDAAYWVGENGYMLPALGGNFEANVAIRREDAAAVLWRYMGCPDSDFDWRVFFDGSKIEDWAKTPVDWACENGLFEYFDNMMLKPLKLITRSEGTVMLYRFSLLLDKQ